jgi:hypothetical protein
VYWIILGLGGPQSHIQKTPRLTKVCPMVDLLHEYWEAQDGTEFGFVSQMHDKQRPVLYSDAKFIFAILASPWGQAMQRYYDKLEFGTYRAVPGVTDIPYTDEQADEQAAYLLVRKRDEYGAGAN